MKKVPPTRVPTRHSLAAADRTALASVRGGKLVRISDTDPSPGDGGEHIEDWMKLW